MKTTLKIPDTIFRRAKAVAAERGIPLSALVSEALRDKLRTLGNKHTTAPWMRMFGKLRHLHRETEKINRIITKEFNQIEREDHQ